MPSVKPNWLHRANVGISGSGINSESDTDVARATLAIETHLARIAQHRPLDQIADAQQHAAAEQIRRWFREVFFTSLTTDDEHLD